MRAAGACVVGKAERHWSGRHPPGLHPEHQPQPRSEAGPALCLRCAHTFQLLALFVALALVFIVALGRLDLGADASIWAFDRRVGQQQQHTPLRPPQSQAHTSSRAVLKRACTVAIPRRIRAKPKRSGHGPPPRTPSTSPAAHQPPAIAVVTATNILRRCTAPQQRLLCLPRCAAPSDRPPAPLSQAIPWAGPSTAPVPLRTHPCPCISPTLATRWADHGPGDVVPDTMARSAIILGAYPPPCTARTRGRTPTGAHADLGQSS